MQQVSTSVQKLYDIVADHEGKYVDSEMTPELCELVVTFIKENPNAFPGNDFYASVSRSSKYSIPQLRGVLNCIAYSQKGRSYEGMKVDTDEIPSGRYTFEYQDKTVNVIVSTMGYVRLGNNAPADKFVVGRLQKMSKEELLSCSQRYGKETGVCGVCGITLTNPESIALGIGPICRSKF